MLLTGTSIMNRLEDIWSQVIPLECVIPLTLSQLCCCRCSHIPHYSDFARLCSDIKSKENSIKNGKFLPLSAEPDNDQQTLDTLLSPHVMVVKREDTATTVSTVVLKPRDMPLPQQMCECTSSQSSSSEDDDDITTDDCDSSSSSRSSSSSSSSTDGTEDSKSHELVVVEDDHLEPKEGTWEVSSSVVINTTHAQPKLAGTWKVYSPPVDELPVAFCQNVLLTPSVQLDSALNKVATVVKVSFWRRHFF